MDITSYHLTKISSSKLNSGSRKIPIREKDEDNSRGWRLLSPMSVLQENAYPKTLKLVNDLILQDFSSPIQNCHRSLCVVMFGLSSNSEWSKTWLSSRTYFLNWDTWKTHAHHPKMGVMLDGMPPFLLAPNLKRTNEPWTHLPSATKSDYSLHWR